MSDQAKRMADLLRRTNAHELLPPPVGETNTTLPGVTVFEIPPKRSTTDPLEANFGEVDILSSLSRNTQPSWLWWMSLFVGWLPSMLAVPTSIYFGWGGPVLALAGGYSALQWSLATVLGALYAAVWTHALFRRKSR